MRLFTTVAGLRCYLNLVRAGSDPGGQGKPGLDTASSPTPPTVGLVPTMGALHAGHLSLMQRARQDNDLVVVSIFVNPIQFGVHEDLDRYPRNLDRDRQQCEQAGVDVIFAPEVAELYPTADLANREALTQIMPPKSMMVGLCGRSRPGHFEGVATVVIKLLNLVQPTAAYFGQKDAQQLAILQRMVADLNLPIEIVPCSIVREPDGLAFSSRNQYLTAEERLQATVLYRSLKQAEALFQQGVIQGEALIAAVKAELATMPQVQPEYVELVHPQTLIPLHQVEESGLLAIAAQVGTTRLIDNIVLRNRKPIVAVDGPAGAGKSTVVRQVAQALGLMYLDTGAMYRAVTWLVLQAGIDIHDEPAIAELVSRCQIHLDRSVEEESEGNTDGAGTILRSSHIPRVWANGQDVTYAIRSPEVTAQVSTIAAQSYVRQELVQQQRAYGRKGGIVMDGRDIGTCVFPDAELKIFLTASVQERARRRQQDLKNQGQPDISLEGLEKIIYERDRLDSTRAISPLRKAPDAIEIETDRLSADEVTTEILTLYRERFQRWIEN